jgi:hypothetical protein
MPEKYFASVTTWQGEYGWEVDVIIEKFTSIIDAVLFGYCVRSLVLEEDCLILIDGDGDRIKLKDDWIRIFELKPESHSKRAVTRENFIEKKIPIQLFSEVKGLNIKKFNLLSFGVLDATSNMTSNFLSQIEAINRQIVN